MSKGKVSDEAWDQLWLGVKVLAELYPDDLVVIGGLAVYLHSIHADASFPAEYTHDVDVCVALASWADLRTEFEVTPNRRLSKYQITVHETAIDVYVEHNNNLRVSYEDLALGATELSGVKVASLEHLLLLKLAAFEDRKGSAHGGKDQRDIAKLLVLLAGTTPLFTLAQVTPEDMELLGGIFKSGVFLEITRRNAKEASELKKKARVFYDRLKTEVGDGGG